MDYQSPGKWLQFALYIFMIAVLGLAIGCGNGSVADEEKSEREDSLQASVTLRAGGGTQMIEELSGSPNIGKGVGKDVVTDLPVTAALAVAAGWKDPVLCRTGRGRYFQKDPAESEELPYFLMYDHSDDLIGIYQYSEFEMPLPWEQMKELRGGGGLPIIDSEHWGLFVYFQDPTRACRTAEAAEARTGTKSISSAVGDHIERGSAVKSTPTPVVPPTPTPVASLVLETVVAKTGKVKALSFELTGDPVAKKIEGTLDRKGALTLVKEGVLTVTDKSRNTQVLEASAVPFSFDSLGATLSGIAAALQDPTDVKSAYIDNLKRRGVTGTVLGSDLSGLIPTAVADASVTVSLWFDEKGRIRRIQIEGAVTAEDASDTVRVLDVGGY